MMSVPSPYNGYYETKHNSATTRQNLIKFRNQKAKQGFSWHSKNFGPGLFIVKSLKKTWDGRSLIDKQNFVIPNWKSSWTFNVQSFT